MPDDPQLSALRARIDAANLELRRQVQARARLAIEAARHKAARGLPVADPAREAEMLAAIAREPEDGLDAAALDRVFAMLFTACREHAQRAVRARP